MLQLKLLRLVRHSPKVHHRFLCVPVSVGVEGSDERKIKSQLLDASLKHVPTKGWTAEAVSLGANELKYPDVMHGLFKDPGASLVQHFIRTSNGQLIEYMEVERSRASQAPKVSFATFVGNAVKYRLQLNLPYMDRMSEALSIATRPDQLPKSLRLLLKMCDDICFYAGDRSTDVSWYTKRTSLAGIYAATELYMVQDKSAEYEETWRFMQRRFDDMKTIGQSTRQVTSAARSIVDVAYSFYVVGRNAIGANTESRSWR